MGFLFVCFLNRMSLEKAQIFGGHLFVLLSVYVYNIKKIKLHTYLLCFEIYEPPGKPILNCVIILNTK